MNRLIAASTLALLSFAWAVPAAARDFVSDQAGMFSAGTVAQLNQKISSFNSATGKEIVVMTVPTIGATTVADAARSAFSQQRVNGVLIFIAKQERKSEIVPGVAEVRAGWFTSSVTSGIVQQMNSQFKNEDFDGGITGAVDSILAIYRQHANSAGAPVSAGAGSSALPSFQGVHISMFWWIIIAVVGFFIIRSIIRAISGPRYYGGGGMPGPGMPPGGGYGYGGGPGYYGGGGGGFFSGLLGGLGGAWLGNELFGNRGGSIDPGVTQTPDMSGGGGGGGWSNDAGQADMGGSSGGDWGGGGFGDSGGGGGFDSGGGGGGDAGGGW